MTRMRGPPPPEPVYSKRSIINIFSYTNSEIVPTYSLTTVVYYKMFDEKGPLNIRDPIYCNNPYIGRVNTSDIPPPHIASSLVRRICAKEGKENNDPFSAELFKTISSPKAYDIREPLSLLNPDRPGSKPEEPLVLKVVYTGMLK
jgi:hypothetical protein